MTDVPNATLVLRWTTGTQSGKDDGFAIDDFSPRVAPRATEAIDLPSVSRERMVLVVVADQARVNRPPIPRVFSFATEAQGLCNLQHRTGAYSRRSAAQRSRALRNSFMVTV
jgi:hypothetical protein